MFLMPLVLFWTSPMDEWCSCCVVSHLERCVCVFEGFNVYITFGQTETLPVHKFSFLLYLCYKYSVIISDSKENTLKYTKLFSVWSTFFQSQELQLLWEMFIFVALYMFKTFYFKKYIKVNVQDKYFSLKLPYQEWKIIWEEFPI